MQIQHFNLLFLQADRFINKGDIGRNRDRASLRPRGPNRR